MSKGFTSYRIGDQNALHYLTPVNTPGEIETYLNTESLKKVSNVKDVTTDTGQEVENAPQ